MRILIHAVALKKAGGSSQHLESFLAALREVSAGHEYTLCLDERYHYSGSMPPGQIVSVSGLTPAKRLWWDQVGVRRLVAKRHIDVILALLTFGATRPPVPQVNFQRTPVYYCERLLGGVGRKERAGLMLRRSLLRRVMSGSKVVVTPSAAMRDDILRVYPELGADRFAVIPHGFDKVGFRKCLPTPDLRAAGETSSTSMERSERPFRILYVSHFLPHKGFLVLPQVARLLAERGLQVEFWFTGAQEDWPRGYRQMMADASAFGVERCLCSLGRVPHEEIARLYAQADLFFFPSLCESFGFPMVEAMGAGLPIAAADTAVNCEICGDAAEYFSCDDASSAADVVGRLAGDLPRRRNLSQRALERFETNVLDMKQYASRVLTLLEAVADESGEVARNRLGGRQE